MHTINNQAIRIGIACVLVITMAGCASPTYPTRTSIDITREKIPELNTIKDGRAYIVDARQNMVDVRDKLNRSEMMLGGGILTGFIAMADGALSNWNTRTVGRLGIFSAALVGVESSLSLKTQQLIINKGITALNCVERNAESAYVPVQQYDSILEKIKIDRDLLDKKINAAKELKKNDVDNNTWNYLYSVIQNNDAFSKRVTAWLGGNSPVATINAGVKVAVNQVIQTTVEQLSSYLPDGSAFSKIGTSLPKSLLNKTVSTSSRDNTVYVMSDGAQQSESGKTVVTMVNEVNQAATRLETDLKEAEEFALPELTQIPSFSCDVATVALPLSLSMLSADIVQTGGAATVTISGGQPPYRDPKITGPSAGKITPSINGSVVLLQAVSGVDAGNYSLVVTDAAGAQTIRSFTVNSASQAHE